MRGLMVRRIVTTYLASKVRRIPLKLAGAALFIFVLCDSANSQLSNPCTGTIKDFPEGEFHMARVIYPTVGWRRFSRMPSALVGHRLPAGGRTLSARASPHDEHVGGR